MTNPNFDDCFRAEHDAFVFEGDGVKRFGVATGSRLAVMVHYDASSSDRSGLGWLKSPKFKLSYHRAYLDNGEAARITRKMSGVRASHAGVCRKTAEVQSANDAFYGFALLANDGDTVTEAQLERLANDIATVAAWHHAYRSDATAREWWSPDAPERWLVGHCEWAIFNKRDNPTLPKLWGKLGRKVDPIGTHDTPVCSLVQLRAHVQTLLETPGSEPLARIGK